MPSSTITSVRPGVRSMSSTSPRMGTTVTLSGASMWYHTHRLPRFWATTTSELGTHCTYEEKESSVERVCVAMSYKWSARRLSRKSSLVPRPFISIQSTLASCVIVASVMPVTRSVIRIVCRSSKYATFFTSAAPSVFDSERRTEMRWGDMCSVRHDPRISLRPYSTSVSSPELKIMHTCGLSKWYFSEPLPAQGTSESLHVSKSPMSNVSIVRATRNRSS